MVRKLLPWISFVSAIIILSGFDRVLDTYVFNLRSSMKDVNKSVQLRTSADLFNVLRIDDWNTIRKAIQFQGNDYGIAWLSHFGLWGSKWDYL